ncbi:MAG: ABC transporter permease subunit [Chloroflexi bacterium]|nr:ABC transporter permease subunit [Chloroflexota bacterium]
MIAVFRHTYRRFQGQILGWSIGLGVYILLMISLYPEIANVDFAAYYQQFPEALMGFFGDAMFAIATPAGYLQLYYFNYMPVIIGIFVVGAAAGLLAGDEERGLLDLVLAQPVSRAAFFWGRVLALAAAVATILAVNWLCWWLPSKRFGLDLTALELLRPFLPLFAELMLVGMLSLALSLLLPSARAASATAGGLLVANYLLTGLANTNEDLKAAVAYTPLHFYQGGEAMEALKWGWVAGLLGAALLLALVAWWRLERRDIRVGGEGGWRLPILTRRKRAA